MTDDLITLNEAAELIGKNLRTIQRYIKAGTLRPHKKDDKNFISRQELEQKFPPLTSQTPFQERGLTGKTDFWREESQKYQEHWTDEVQKHAQTREELGEWKGRAEAYQQFASRLLGNGATSSDMTANIKKDDTVVPSSSKVSPYLIYIVAGVVIIGLVVLVLLLQLYK